MELALRHSVHFMDLMCSLVMGWMWMSQATHAQRGLREGRHDAGFLRGKLSAAQYWFRTELPRVSQLAALCQSNEPSYAQMQDDWW
jgi:butyryl-CoA dehydrogenase